MENFAKGSEYDRLLKDFLDRGGDLSLCPFDSGDYRYEGPEGVVRPEGVEWAGEAGFG